MNIPFVVRSLSKSLKERDLSAVCVHVCGYLQRLAEGAALLELELPMTVRYTMLTMVL